MCKVDILLGTISQPAMEDQAVLPGQHFTFYEEFIEGGMACIGSLRSEDDFTIACQA
jgi:hypothetical protein